MKYYRWNLLLNCGFGMCNVILGTSMLTVKSEKWLCILGAIAVAIFLASLIGAKVFKHDIYDEASMETELKASRLAHIIILLIFVLLLSYVFVIRKPVDKIYSKICILYGIIYMLPAICFAYYEKKALKVIEKYESED